MNTQKFLPILSLAVIGTLYGATPALASSLLEPDLASFTVLGASTVTNIPASAIDGNVGVWSSGGANAITGFLSSPNVAVADPQLTNGLVHAGTPLAQAAQGELTTAINDLGSLGAGTLLSLADMAGLTLFPGIYTVPAGTTNLSGTLTLDGQGNANAAWVFQMPSTLITSPNSIVNIINTGSGAGVFWDVGSSATLDVNTTFIGNILAQASITINTSATDLCGRALAATGAVTLQQNILSSNCTGITSGSHGLSGGLEVTGTTVGFLPASTSVPEPSTLSLMLIGIAGYLLKRSVEQLASKTVPAVISI